MRRKALVTCPANNSRNDPVWNEILRFALRRAQNYLGMTKTCATVVILGEAAERRIPYRCD